ncbi:adenylosuccinate synthetase, partial [Aeromonas caviae]|uniref:adenylosuccinate synthetase n=1 Tax=Aeromonas caviae TaxID=648 RepID=UPI0038CF85FE
EGAHTENPIWLQTAALKPVYEQMESWSEDITGCRTFEELPRAAQQYVLRIEALLGVPVPMVSVGPGRDEMILR